MDEDAKLHRLLRWVVAVLSSVIICIAERMEEVKRDGNPWER